MGPAASKRGIDHKPGTEDFTEDRRHESQASSTRSAASTTNKIAGIFVATLNKRGFRSKQKKSVAKQAKSIYHRNIKQAEQGNRS